MQDLPDLVTWMNLATCRPAQWELPASGHSQAQACDEDQREGQWVRDQRAGDGRWRQGSQHRQDESVRQRLHHGDSWFQQRVTILQKKAWRLLGTVFNFSFFPRDLGFYEKPKESRERILCTLPWTPTSTQLASAYQFSTFKFSLRVSLSVVSQLWDVKDN